jgi:hypothetical protein
MSGLKVVKILNTEDIDELMGKIQSYVGANNISYEDVEVVIFENGDVKITHDGTDDLE